MSIVTLKKKTQTKYNNMSVGSKVGFSLNGTHRSQGYVGQTMLSRSLPRTLMRGNTERGHGGCCGKYPIHPIIQSAVISTEDINVVKPSVISNDGMIETKYRWIHRPAPYATVKPDNNLNINDQQDYITRLRKKTITDSNACQETKTLTQSCASTACMKANYNTYFRTPIVSFTKPESNYTAMSQGEYLLKLDNKCADHDVITTTTNSSNTPFACF